MSNIKDTIAKHNKSQLNNSQDPRKYCNCRDKTRCPINGKCKEEGIIYQAIVKAKDSENRHTAESTETYIGLTETEFKHRYVNHKQSYNNVKLKNSTELSKYIWTLKEKKTKYQIGWKIISKSKPYSNTSKRCNLGLQEKYFIICHPEKATLNERARLVTSCRHSTKILPRQPPNEPCTTLTSVVTPIAH